MKMEKQFCGALMLLATALSACSDANEVDPVVPNDAEPTTTHYLLSDSELEAAAKAAMSDFAPVSRAGSLHVKDVINYSQQSRATGENGSALLVVNFEEGGFVVLPNDKRASSYYAVSVDGEYQEDEFSGMQLFMDMAVDYMAEEVKNGTGVRRAPGTSPGPDDPRFYPKIDHSDHQCYAVSRPFVTKVEELIVTHWHQYSPYNKYCKTLDGKEAPAGCYPIALAQVMGFHKKPQTFNGHTYLWDSFVTSSLALPSLVEDNLAMLINDIGITGNITYRESGSPMNDPNALSTLKQFGYKSIKFISYNYEFLKSELNHRRPVIMVGSRSGGAHAWVVDGYRQEDTIITYVRVDNLEECSNGSGPSYKYLHCNWGNGINLDCYCVAGVFMMGTAHYDSDLKAIINIY